jgi:RNA polymerase sigma-70 factor (sigma-E family)
MRSADRGEFADFVASRQRRLQQAAWLLTGDAAYAEDLVQDALAKTWRHWRRVRAAEDVDAYVHRVLTNTFVSSRRRRWWAEQPGLLLEAAAEGEPDVATSISLLAALQRLPHRQRAVVVLRFYADLSVEQVADALGCAPGTVKSSTAKAIAALRADPDVHALVEEAR